MAHLQTLPPQEFTVKSCSAWTDTDLSFLNVHIVDIDAPTFFGGSTKTIPAPSVSPAILNTRAAYPQQLHALQTHTALTNEERLFFKYLEEAMVPGDNQASAIVDFTIHALQLMGFTEPKPSNQYPEQNGQHRRVLRKDHDLPLFMCGRVANSTADASLLLPCAETEAGDTLLLLAKAAPFLPSDSRTSPEAQLFAQAIGTFQCCARDRRRARRSHISTVDERSFLGIIMRGTTPILYKLNITANLVECVQSGLKPLKMTKMLRLELPSKLVVNAQKEGMIPLENRKVLLGYLEALKGII
ncbi:hypothetical protein DXG01_013894 [Tephrocybe rancida]|nr:hypothetical protein DXG01_013894 [Tephrocybe rancida]